MTGNSGKIHLLGEHFLSQWRCQDQCPVPDRESFGRVLSSLSHLEVSFNLPQDQIMTIRLYCRPDLNLCMQNVEANGKRSPEDKHIPPAISLADSQDPVHRSGVGKFQQPSSHNYTTTTQASLSYSINATISHSPSGNALVLPGAKCGRGRPRTFQNLTELSSSISRSP